MYFTKTQLKRLGLFFSYLFFAVPFFAQAGGGVDSADDVYEILARLFTLMYSFFFAAAAFIIVYAAFLMLSAGGDPSKMEKAKKVLLYSVSAIVVAVLALSVTGVIERLLIG